MMAVLQNKNDPLTRVELQELFDDETCWTSTIPVTPVGGQVFCYSSVDQMKKGMYNEQR